MKKAFNITGLVLALLLAFSSCQKAPFLTFAGQKSFTFKDAGGSETITFSCNRAWTATSSESWLTVSPAKGDANEEGVRVTITCAANTTYDSRNATITISSEGLTETISVSQDTNYGLMSEHTTFNLTNEAQNIEVEVKANVEYTITIDDACKDWISQVGTKALSSTKLTFSIAANESYDDREGKITISQKGSASSVQPQVITVKQSQTNGLFITTPEYELSNEAHDLTIEVKSNINYEVTSEVDWIKYEASSTKALSATTFTLKVDKNETYDQRVGTVKVKGGGLEGIITITQAENLGLFVSPAEVQISKDAQEVEIEVQANVEYDIIVPEEAKGMITTIKKQGGETKALSATKYLVGVSENTKYVGREASITFKQKDGALCGTFGIEQNKVDTVFVNSNKYELSWKGEEFTVVINSSTDYTIETPAWITEISHSETDNEGLKVSSYVYKCEENLDVEKDDKILIKWKNESRATSTLVSITQSCCTISLNFPGTLLQELTSARVPKVMAIKVIGEINGSDIIILRRMNNIKKMDLSQSSIVSGGQAYYGDYTTKDNVIGRKMFSDCFCNDACELLLPNDVTEIESEAFSGCHNLSSVSLPSKLKILRSYAFPGCWGLTDINLPEGLEVIELGAFDQAHSLESITIPSTVSKIENYAFRGNYSMKTVRLLCKPSTLTSIGADLFIVYQATPVYSTATLYIPKGTYNDYYLTDFGRFDTIVEE